MQQPPGGWGPPGYPPQHQAHNYPPAHFYGAAPLQAPAWTCPFCRYQGQPTQHHKISTGGWVVFAVLLVFCFPICWIGLGIRETTIECTGCGTPVGRS